METILLLALGAWVVSRMGGTSSTVTPPPSAAQLPPPQASLVPVEFSSIRLPHIVRNGKELVVLTLPLPADAKYKVVECREPGGAVRVSDIQSKWVNYQSAYADWVAAGRPRKKKFLKPLEQAQEAYKTAVAAHFTSCTNYAKQL